MHIFKKVVFLFCLKIDALPLGPPRPFLGPQRKTQPTFVISDRSSVRPKWAWCSRGVHIFKMCVSTTFSKNNVSVVISAPLGVRGPLRAPPGRPTGSSWGLPWPLLRPQRKTQPTVVISVRTASLFRQNGPGARYGCTFLETLFFSLLSNPPTSPWGSCGRF